MTSEREREYQKRYRAAHREELNAYKNDWSKTQRRLNTDYAIRQRTWNREYRRRKKGYIVQVAGLHELACTNDPCSCGEVKLGTVVA